MNKTITVRMTRVSHKVLKRLANNKGLSLPKTLEELVMPCKGKKESGMKKGTKKSGSKKK